MKVVLLILVLLLSGCATYSYYGTCYNCSRKVVYRIPKGVEVGNANLVCPVCGVGERE